MLRRLFAFLILISGLSSCSNAHGQENLNIDLFCEGKAELTFEDPNTIKGYENFRELFGDATGLKLLPGLNLSENFSERLSIKNNAVGKLKLRVFETKIYISAESQKEAKENGFSITGDLDRLTGKLEFKILLSKARLTEYFQANFLLEELGVNGVSLKGDCAKLDPNKKLF
jgi:hypothetical protein